MINKNPTQVQYAPRRLAAEARKRVPLVLIHDGGGTVFGYHALGDLERDVWALHNPRLFSGEPWESMDEMAEHYIGLLVKAGIRGHIMLGGDSPRTDYYSIWVAGSALTTSIPQVGHWEDWSL